ncbi:MAG: SulP family inorganic anion transporter [Actinomycetota bacterium]|nr:SulP family inorganic anion transporter [Actinomycetota bacterium]
MTDVKRSESLKRWWQTVKPAPGTLKDEAIAGLPRAAAAVPDGMAAAALVGVSPIHGLYASFVSPIAGGLSASTRLMVITTTSAAALAAFSALEGVPADDRLGALILLTLLAGLVMFLAGFLGLGRLTGFVSHSVMTGFLTGVAINIILGQIGELVGSGATGDIALTEAVRAITEPSLIHVPSLLVGGSALLLLWLLPATSLSRYSALIALGVTSVAVTIFSVFDDVLIVSDAGAIPRGFPRIALPSLSYLSPSLIVGAFAVAAIVLVQGAGVAESAPNPDRTRSNANRDFMAQGWANVASGLFRGIPVGGSVSQTALNLSVGARDRWASIMSGVWMLAVLVLFSRLAGQVALPTLAAILIVASIGAIQPGEIATVWRSGSQSQIAMMTTFVSTIFLPVAAAVGIGMALSLLLSVNRQAQDVKVVGLAVNETGGLTEGPAPSVLSSDSITVLHIYGSLFYAGARTFERALPGVGMAERAVVIIRIRGKSMMGATAFAVLSKYAGQLAEAGGRLYLSGVSEELISQFEQSGRIESSGPIDLFEATPLIGESTRLAFEEAESFLLGEVPDKKNDLPHPDPWFNRTTAAVKDWFGSRNSRYEEE